VTTILVSSAVLVGLATAPATARSAPALQPVVVELDGTADLGRLPTKPQPRREEVVRRLQLLARTAQAPLLTRLAQLQATGAVADIRPLWLDDTVALRATPAVVAELRARPEVRQLRADPVAVLPSAEPGVEAVGAPTLWAAGTDGAGAVVAVLDSGVDLQHPALAGRWRGGPHDWFDPTGTHAEPVDPTGHGTGVTSILVGGEGLGVAPGATFISAKIFDDSGATSESGIHAALQWALDPDGDPATADGADVVNGSWGFATPGCDLRFEPDLAALRAAGVLSVFSAGNTGPWPGSSISPANNPSALSVGAVSATDELWATSGRGPSACSGAGGYPDLVAPGVDVRAADLFGGYATVSGTSLATPHVTGGLALLLSGHPGASPDALEAAIRSSAHDLGVPGPDDAWTSWPPPRRSTPPHRRRLHPRRRHPRSCWCPRCARPPTRRVPRCSATTEPARACSSTGPTSASAAWTSSPSSASTRPPCC
jgi:subtilisin family serine protease